MILTGSVLFPAITPRQIITIMIACGAVSALAAGWELARRLRGSPAAPQPAGHADRQNWRMPPLNLLRRPAMSAGRKVGMAALRLYLGVAMVLVIIKIVQLALRH